MLLSDIAFCAKSLSEPMMTHCQLETWNERDFCNIQSKYKIIYENVDYFRLCLKVLNMLYVFGAKFRARNPKLTWNARHQ